MVHAEHDYVAAEGPGLCFDNLSDNSDHTPLSFDKTMVLLQHSAQSCVHPELRPDDKVFVRTELNGHPDPHSLLDHSHWPVG
jgi:hypothetical protein